MMEKAKVVLDEVKFCPMCGTKVDAQHEWNTDVHDDIVDETEENDLVLMQARSGFCPEDCSPVSTITSIYFIPQED